MASNDNSLLIKINGTAKGFLKELDKVNKKSKETQDILKKVGKASAAAFVGLSTVILGTTKAFADYQTALTGVGKTTNKSGADLKKFGKEIQNLSSRIPVATNSLLGIAQSAAQLGVEGDANILKFTETIAKLGVATDLTGEEGATAIARVLNITGEGVGVVDKFGAALVDLGNNFAATESEILRATTEVSRATGVFGVSSAQAAAYGTALKSVGVQAQLGGSAIGRSFRAIETAINTGGESFKNLEIITGLTGESLRKTFKDDSAAVFNAFTKGLGEVIASGGSAQETLERFGLSGDEINKVLPVLAKNYGIVAKATETANVGFKEATALNKEAATAFDTVNSRFQILKNNATTAAVQLGEKFAPSIEKLLAATNKVVTAFINLDDETKENIAAFIKWGAIIAGGIATAAAFALGAIKVSAIITSLTVAFGPAALAASGFWVALTGPIGIAIAGIAALTVGVVALFNTLKEDTKPKSLENINSELDKLKEKQDALKRAQGGGFRNERRIKRIQQEIDKLEELQKSQIKATSDFDLGGKSASLSTSGSAVRSEGAPSSFLDTLGKTPEPEAPNFSTELDAVKEKEDKKTALEKVGNDERLQAAKDAQALLQKELSGATDAELEVFQRRLEIRKEEREALKIEDEKERADKLAQIGLKKQILQKDINEAAAERSKEAEQKLGELSNEREILEAHNAKKSQEEINFIRRRQELTARGAAALEERNAEVRESELGIIAAHKQQLLEQEKKFLEQKAITEKEDAERRKELDELLREEELETGEVRNEEDQELLLERIQTKEEIEQGVRDRKLEADIKEREKFIEDTYEHGENVAKINQFFDSEQVKRTRSATGELAKLTRSRNSTLKSIGKVAALANIAIDTPRAAVKAYAELGPVLGPVAAGAIIAFGAEQAADVIAAQDGALVTGGIRGVDSQPFMLGRGELVAPDRSFDEVVEGTALSRGFTPPEDETDTEGGSGGMVTVRVEVVPKDDAIEFIEQQIEERRIQRTGL